MTKYNTNTGLTRLFKSRTVIILIGNSGSGKGTLLAAIEAKCKELLPFSFWEKVQNYFFSFFGLTKKIKQKYFISETGALFRSKTPLFSKVFREIGQKSRNQGNIQPAVIATTLWAHHVLHNYKEGVIIMDGSPRTKEEAVSLLDFFNFYGFRRIFVHLDVGEDICRERLETRNKELVAKGLSPREDCNTPEKMETKLGFFKTDVLPAIKFLSLKKEKVITIQANRLSKREVQDQFFTRVLN